MMGPHIKDTATPLMARPLIKDIVIWMVSHKIEVAVLHSVGLHITELAISIVVGPHNDIMAITILLGPHIKDIITTPILVVPQNKGIMEIKILVPILVLLKIDQPHANFILEDVHRHAIYFNVLDSTDATLGVEPKLTTIIVQRLISDLIQMTSPHHMNLSI